MCMHALGGNANNDSPDDGDSDTPVVRPVDIESRKSTEVPLGTGLADQAKQSILSRRDKIRQALEDAGA